MSRYGVTLTVPMMSDLLALGLVGAVAIILWLGYQLWHLRQQISQEAMNQFQAWRAKDYESLKREQGELATREAQLQLEMEARYRVNDSRRRDPEKPIGNHREGHGTCRALPARLRVQPQGRPLHRQSC